MRVEVHAAILWSLKYFFTIQWKNSFSEVTGNTFIKTPIKAGLDQSVNPPSHFVES